MRCIAFCEGHIIPFAEPAPGLIYSPGNLSLAHSSRETMLRIVGAVISFLPYTRYGIFFAVAQKDATGASALPCQQGAMPPLDSPTRAFRHGEGRCPSADRTTMRFRATSFCQLPRAARLRTIDRRCHAYAMTSAVGSIDAPLYSGGCAPPDPAPGDNVPWTPIYHSVHSSHTSLIKRQRV